MLNVEGETFGMGPAKLGHSEPVEEIERSAADRWIMSRLQKTKRAVADAIEGYRFDHAAQAIYEFTWNEYCDWYLELSKPVLNGPGASDAARRGTRRTLVRVLENLLRLAHPIMPFITEEIWQRAAPLAGVIDPPTPERPATIMTQPFPRHRRSLVNEEAEREMEWVRQFILGIRKIKGEMNIPPGTPVPVLLANTNAQDREWAVAARPYLDFLAKTASITVLAEGDEEPESALALVGEMKVLIPLAGLIDKEAELARLQKEIDRQAAEVDRIGKKLANPNFVDKAPETVVEKERGKMAAAESALAKLKEQAARIGRL
jgi:valyl-tRNA synthetase